jgi:rubrerythrin
LEEQDEFTDLIKKQIRNERESIQLFRSIAKKPKNPVIKFLLHEIVLDSVRHLDTLQTILKLLSGSVVSDSENEELKSFLKEHIHVEERALNALEEAVDTTKDGRIRYLLQNLAADERRHHSVLNHLIQLLSSKKAVGDEKWWDFLYRYSRLST